jgi:hypothetical protein
MEKPITLFFTVTFFFGISAVVHGQVEPRQLDSRASLDNNYWRLSISPYLWLAGMDGTGGLAGRGVEVHQSFGDILRHLKVGAMALSEVRRKRVGLIVDLLYIRVGDQQAFYIAGIPNGLGCKSYAEYIHVQSLCRLPCLSK